MRKLALTLAATSLATTSLTRHAPTGPDEMERRLPMVGDRGTRLAGFAPSTYDAETRSVEVVMSAGSAVRRWGFTEELAIEVDAIDLTRVDRGLVSALDTHNQYEASAVCGRVSDVRIEGGELIGRITFGETDRAREIEGMVARGELRGVSIGYRVTEWKISQTDDSGHETWRASAWELLEVSFVSVPADANAGVRSITGQLPGTNEEEEEMRRNLPGGAAAPAVMPAAAAAPAIEPVRAAPVEQVNAGTRFTATQAMAFVDSARAFGDAIATRASELVTQNENGEVTVEAARAAILTEAASAQRAATGAPTGSRPIEMPEAQFAARAEAMSGAILHRVDPGRYPLAENHRDFRGQNLRTMARSFLDSSGISTRGMSDVEVARSAMQTRAAGMHSTSDFPNILGSVVRRTLRDAYELAPKTYTGWARRTNFTDFRPLTRVSLSDGAVLKKVEEHGEYEYGTMGEGAETLRALKYGRIIAVTWEAIINDDLGALSRIPQAFGASAAQMESDIAYNVLIANGNLADGNALFTTGRGNLAAAGTAITIASLTAANVAMMQQKAPNGSFLAAIPGILLVGPQQKLAAYQFTSSNYVPVTNGTINPAFNQDLKVIVDPRITDLSWYLMVDPTSSALDTVEYGYLDGEEGVMIEERRGFEVDGLEIKARLVFGAGAIEPRGMYRNPGA